MNVTLPAEGFRDLETAPTAELTPRERLLRTALELFYQHGVNSVGVDRIIAESGVAKMTFYRHFPSKAKLVAAYLAYKDEAWQRLLHRYTGDESQPAAERLLAIFDALEFFVKDPTFRGCPFIKGLAEFGPERNEPEVKARIFNHFSDAEKLVTKLLKQIRPRDFKKFVPPLMALITGTIVVAQATGQTDVALKNRELARMLVLP